MESKVMSIIINAPVRAYSFFGVKSRELVKKIHLLNPNYNIKIFNYNENNTRNDFIDNEINDLITSYGDVSTPDIWIQFGHPGSFEKRGVKNIGITISSYYNPIGEFVSGCNRMDMILTYSQYSKVSIENLKYNDVRVTVPVIVLPEYPILFSSGESNSSTLLQNVKTKWNFLCEGYWETTDEVEFGGKNKDNIGFVIRTFLDCFKNTDIRNDIGLILNVHGNMASVLDETRLIKKINNIKKEQNIQFKDSPKIYLINQDLTANEKISLYKDPKVCALLSIPQRSDSSQKEIDFVSISKKPIIYSNYGSQKEMLSYGGNIGCGSNLKDNGSCPVIIDTFTSELKLSMYDMYLNYSYYKKLVEDNNYADIFFDKVIYEVLNTII